MFRLNLTTNLTRLCVHRRLALRLFTNSTKTVDDYVQELEKSFDSSTLVCLKPKISALLERFNYELYKLNLEVLSPDDYETFFRLEPHQMHDLLEARDSAEQERMLRFFTVGKVKTYESHLARLEAKASKPETVYSDNKNRSGLFGPDGELSYGLWHNTLFSKMKRSSVSHLFDRKMVSWSMMESPRLLFDLDYASQMDYFRQRHFCYQLRLLLGFNKYTALQPFQIEFCQTQPLPPKLPQLLSRYMPWWDDPTQFQYVRHDTKSPADLVENRKNLIYITASASKKISIDELRNPETVLTFPGYVTRSLRDVVHNKINTSRRFQVRRLPTAEYVTWKDFHGVLGFNVVFAVLHDMKFRTDSWREAFDSNLKENLVKSAEELELEEKIRQKIHKKRIANIERASSSSSELYQFPNKIKVHVVHRNKR